jgi:hypothetical protein
MGKLSREVRDFMLSMAPIKLGTGPEHTVGWAIGTVPLGAVEDQAAEQGIPQDNAFWGRINLDFHKLERNTMNVMTALGMQLSDEGHSSADELVGTARIREGGAAWRLWQTLGEDVLRDHQICSLWRGADEMLWLGVSELGRSLLACDFRFLEAAPRAQEAQAVAEARIGRR